mgnify:CR=1 FL=1
MSIHHPLLAKLARAEAALPALLADAAGWEALLVDYEPPTVERLWRPWEDGRLSLHEIHPCAEDEAMYHPHKWPSAMRIVEGIYGMRIGSGHGMEPPPVGGYVELSAGDRYAMADPAGWHAVIPQGGPVLTVMATGPLWEQPAAKKSSKPLGPLSPQRKEALLRRFQGYYPPPRA